MKIEVIKNIIPFGFYFQIGFYGNKVNGKKLCFHITFFRFVLSIYFYFK